MEQKIKKIFYEMLEQNDIKKIPLDEQTILLETGLDSLGFAILVSKLEEELLYDPFQIMEEAFYPKTWGELLEVYKKYKPPQI